MRSYRHGLGFYSQCIIACLLFLVSKDECLEGDRFLCLVPCNSELSAARYPHHHRLGPLIPTITQIIFIPRTFLHHPCACVNAAAADDDYDFCFTSLYISVMMSDGNSSLIIIYIQLYTLAQWNNIVNVTVTSSAYKSKHVQAPLNTKHKFIYGNTEK